MRLTWRDVLGTGFVALAVGATLSVVYGWNWPLIGDARAGGVALFVLSYPSCLLGQAPKRMQEAIEHRAGWSGYLIGATVLGAVTTVLIFADLILNSAAVLVAATAVLALLWFVATVDHAVAGTGRTLTIRA